MTSPGEVPSASSLSLSLCVDGKQAKDTSIYPGSGRPKANSPTPACLDRCEHHGVATMESPARYPGKGFGERKEKGQILALRTSPPFSSLP